MYIHKCVYIHIYIYIYIYTYIHIYTYVHVFNYIAAPEERADEEGARRRSTRVDGVDSGMGHRPSARRASRVA